MSRRSKKDWQALVEEQACSGLSAAAFCRDKDINAKYFSLRKSQLSKKIPSAFVPVQLSTLPSDEYIRIDCQGALLILPINVSSTWAADCVKQLSI